MTGTVQGHVFLETQVGHNHNDQMCLNILCPLERAHYKKPRRCKKRVLRVFGNNISARRRDCIVAEQFPWLQGLNQAYISQAKHFSKNG